MLTENTVVDALPYIDTEYDEPGMKDMVQAMIEEEKKHYRPTKNYLEHLPPLELHKFETDVLKKEFERLAQRLPMETLGMKRYELPPPPTGKLNDLAAWKECIDNSHAQLEHQFTRISNLELMQEFSSESWKSYLTVLTSMVTQAQKQITELKKNILEINWERKQNQMSAGEQLRRLENSWVGLVSKNYEIERVCNELELQVRYLKQLREQQQQAEAQNPTSTTTSNNVNENGEQQSTTVDQSNDEQEDNRMDYDENQETVSDEYQNRQIEVQEEEQEAQEQQQQEEDEESSPPNDQDETPSQSDYPDADKIANDPEREEME